MEHAWKQPLSSQAPRGVRNVMRVFSPFERLLFALLTAIAITSGLTLVYRVNNMFLVDVPATGGNVVEGVIGSPRFINPLLALSDADRDLTALFYTGLMRPTANGGLKPALASGYSVSDDGLRYRFYLRDTNAFSDGTPLNADDVVFTIQTIQNPAFKSPLYANWEDVTVTKINDYTVEFTLPQPYAPFLENTTVGILPKRIWEHATPDEFPLSNYNIEPIGAGPYALKTIQRGTSGIPQAYILTPNKHFALGKPHISSIAIRFYHTEQDIVAALKTGDINATSGLSPSSLKDLTPLHAITTHHAPLPRVFGVFFNQNKVEAFQAPEVRKALALITPKDAIVQNVLGGYGTVLDGPLPPGILPTSSSTDTTAVASSSLEQARELLTDADWKQNEATHVWEKDTDKGKVTLSFTLSTTNVPELKAAAERIASSWRTLGANVELKVFEPTDLTQNIIRPRRYDALLFGEVIGREPDLYAFWHSSQRNDPGLNIAMYTNIATDKLLEQARTTLSMKKRAALYEEFEASIHKEIPAVFLYSPDLIYLLPADIQNVSLTRITAPDERFQNVQEWYTATDRVWPFVKKLIE